jgi:NAD(P)-dependent dehydrogenase (short-subunit alcohol dehydrogenase family)
MQKRFEDKVVLITGATAGIGKVTALAFAREGARVVVTGRRVDEGNAVVELIRSEGGEALFVKTDVSKTDEVRSMVARTIEAYGKLDCAFNNAGIAGEAGLPTADHTEETWDLVMNVNLKAVWLSMKYEIPEMLRNGKGVIVNNSSIYGLAASTVGHVPYAVSKHGVIGLTRTAAFEYAKKGIRVNAVCPAFTHSEMVDKAIDELPPEYIQEVVIEHTPMGRIAETQEIADVVLWLCSDESTYVTGQAIAPDGGWLAK